MGNKLEKIIEIINIKQLELIRELKIIAKDEGTKCMAYVYCMGGRDALEYLLEEIKEFENET